MKAKFSIALGSIHSFFTKYTAHILSVGIFYSFKIKCQFGTLTFKLWLSQGLTVSDINKILFGRVCGIFLLSSNSSFFGKQITFVTLRLESSKYCLLRKMAGRNIWLLLPQNECIKWAYMGTTWIFLMQGKAEILK